MDPAIISALIGAGMKLFELFVKSGTDMDESANEKVAAWVSKHFEELHGAVTTNSARLLAIMETGQPLKIAAARHALLKDEHIPQDLLPLFDAEFEYRLQYLRLIGMRSTECGNSGFRVWAGHFLRKRAAAKYMAMP